MADFLSKNERSLRMAAIRSEDTSPELALRSALHRMGLRFRLHSDSLPGKPDIVLPRYKAVILVHGCFWHRHKDCKVANTPKSNTAFWLEKFDRNVERDLRVTNELKARGWRVLTAWECELSSRVKAQGTAERLATTLFGHDTAEPVEGL